MLPPMGSSSATTLLVSKHFLTLAARLAFEASLARGTRPFRLELCPGLKRCSSGKQAASRGLFILKLAGHFMKDMKDRNLDMIHMG